MLWTLLFLNPTMQRSAALRKWMWIGDDGGWGMLGMVEDGLQMFTSRMVEDTWVMLE